MYMLSILGFFLAAAALTLQVFIRRWRRRLKLTEDRARKISAWSMLAVAASVAFSLLSFVVGAVGVDEPILLVMFLLVAALLALLAIRAVRDLRPAPSTWREEISDQYERAVNRAVTSAVGLAFVAHGFLLAGFFIARTGEFNSSMLASPIPALLAPAIILLGALIPLSQYRAVKRLRVAAESRPQLDEEQIDELYVSDLDLLEQRVRMYPRQMNSLTVLFSIFAVAFILLVLSVFVWKNQELAGILFLITFTAGILGAAATLVAPIFADIQEHKVRARLSIREQLVGRLRAKQHEGLVRFADALTDPDRSLHVLQISSLYAGDINDVPSGALVGVPERTVTGIPFPGESPLDVEGPEDEYFNDADEVLPTPAEEMESRITRFFMLRGITSGVGGDFQGATRAFIDTLQANANGDRFDVFCDYTALYLVKVGDADYEPVPNGLAHKILDAVNAAQ